MRNNLQYQRIQEPHWAAAIHQVTQAAYGGHVTWRVSDFAHDLTQEQAVYWACVCNGVLIGYIAAHCVFDEATIVNFAVLPQWQRCGVGQRLWEQLQQELRRDYTTTVFLEVRESNGQAQRFYEKNGFTQLSLRPQYYQHPTEAAVIYQWKE